MTTQNPKDLQKNIHGKIMYQTLVCMGFLMYVLTWGGGTLYPLTFPMATQNPKYHQKNIHDKIK